MKEKLFKLYLSLARKKFLIPFLDGLVNIGRPSETLFPEELIDQGLGLILSGLNNTMAIQSNLDWIWPFWIESQQNPSNPGFIPTGVNLLTVNLSHRNWTSLGIGGSKHESMIDPVGMLTLRPYGWSVFPYISFEEKQYFPPKISKNITQELEEHLYPIVNTHYKVIPQLNWSSQTAATLDKDEEIIVYQHFIKNLSNKPINLKFGMSLRPYNPLTIGHINKIKYKNKLWRINRMPGLLLGEEPDRIKISNRLAGDTLTSKYSDTKETQRLSKSGILSASFEYDISLKPNEEKTIETFGTLFHRQSPPPTRFDVKRRKNSKNLIQALKEQIEIANKTQMQISIPDKKLENSFNAILNRLHVFDDGEYYTPGTFLYHTHWIRDSVFINTAFENTGLSNKMEKKFNHWMGLQSRDGYFKSQNGEWDSNGQVLFSVVNHFLRIADLEKLSKYMPKLIKGAKWIENMCKKSRTQPSPHYGLLPAGFSAEHFGPNDHYYWDNFWSLAGLEKLSIAIKKLNYSSHDKWIAEFTEQYLNDISESIDNCFLRNEEKGLSCSPYRKLDSASIGNLVGITPLGIFTAEEPWVKPTLEFLSKNNLQNNLFFQKIIHTGKNPYLSAQLAKAQIHVGNENAALEIVSSLLDHATETFTWPEAIHPITGGGCMGDGDHGWAAAEYVNLIRDMFVTELGETLVIAAAVPENWFSIPGSINIRNAATNFGMLSYDLTWNNEEMLFKWDYTQNKLMPALKTVLRLPRFFGGKLNKQPVSEWELPYPQGERSFPKKSLFLNEYT